MLIEQTLTKMRAMRLTVMADSFQQRLDRGDHQEVSAEDFVGLLIDDEYTAKQNRKLSRMIGKANFKPENACIENIQYRPDRGFQKKDILQFTSPTWINNAQNLVLLGACGTGKTFLAEAIGLQACRMGFKTKKIRYKILLEEIQAKRGTGLYLKYLEQMAKFKILIIDDFLMAPANEENVSDLFDILEDRCLTSPTIITTQYPVKKWHALLPDPTVADAICDRLIHKVITLNLKGESMRKNA